MAVCMAVVGAGAGAVAVSGAGAGWVRFGVVDRPAAVLAAMVFCMSLADGSGDW